MIAFGGCIMREFMQKIRMVIEGKVKEYESQKQNKRGAGAADAD